MRRLGYEGSLLEVDARDWEGDSAQARRASVVAEVPIVLVYNHVPHVVMMATPEDLEDFAVGFSITEELVSTPSELHSITIERFSQGIEIKIGLSPERGGAAAERARKLSGRTGCGICGASDIASVLKTVHPVSAGTPVAPAIIHRALEELTRHQRLNHASGAVHAAGWAALDGSIVVAREDVGRHNALDKLVGAVLTLGVTPADGFVVVTSRASFEMVQKTTVLGAPLLAAISGPTALAIQTAEAAGLTLVGFARGQRLTVYTHPERIVSGPD